MKKRNLIILSIFCLFLQKGLRADAWATSGKGNMTFDVSGLPSRVGEENLVWKLDSGTKHQYPKPEVIGDKLLIMGTGEGNPDPYWGDAVSKGGSVVCRDLRTGEQIWRLIVPETGYGPATYGACGSPVVLGNRIYVVTLYDVFCLDLNGLADGNQGAQNELELMTRRGFKVPKGEGKPTDLPDWAADVIWHYSMRELNIDEQDAISCTPVAYNGQLWVSTAHEMGSEARGYEIQKKNEAGERIKTGKYRKADPAPHLIVLDMSDGTLIAKDNIDVPIIFHGAWSSPALLEVGGEAAVIYGDGYGMIHGFGIPEPSPDGEPVILETLWSFDPNLHEERYDELGRRHPYTKDQRLAYKYPVHWPDDEEKWIPIETNTWGGAALPGGPSEIIAIPAVVENRVYVGLGGDHFYDFGKIPAERNPKGNLRGRKFGPGRFLCLEFDSIYEAPRIRWEDRDIGRTQASASVVDGLVYVTDNAGYINCYDAMTGEVFYRYDLGAAALERSQFVADGKIYASDNNGFLHILKAGREPVLLDKHRLRGHAATVEATNGAIVVATGREVMLFSDHALK